METDKMKKMINDAFKKEKKREENARYRAAHREELNKLKKEKYKKDKSRFLEANKRWIAKNRDYWNAYQREYRKRRKGEHVEEQVDKPSET